MTADSGTPPPERTSDDPAITSPLRPFNGDKPAAPAWFHTALAEAPVQTSVAAMAAVLSKVETIEEAIRTADWPLFEATWQLRDRRAAAATRIKERVLEVLTADEHAIALKTALDEQRGKASDEGGGDR